MALPEPSLTTYVVLCSLRLNPDHLSFHKMSTVYATKTQSTESLRLTEGGRLTAMIRVFRSECVCPDTGRMCVPTYDT